MHVAVDPAEVAASAKRQALLVLICTSAPSFMLQLEFEYCHRVTLGNRPIDKELAIASFASGYQWLFLAGAVFMGLATILGIARPAWCACALCRHELSCPARSARHPARRDKPVMGACPLRSSRSGRWLRLRLGLVLHGPVVAADNG